MSRATTILALACLLSLASPVWAGLDNYFLNVNGTTYTNAFPGSVSGSLLTPAGINSGTGTMVVTFSNPGSYFFAAYLDFDVDLTFYNEFGSKSGSPAAGQTWQIDESHAYSDSNRTGTAFGNVGAFNGVGNVLDNTNHTPGVLDNLFADCGANGGGAVNTNCNTDVALAMGFSSFTVGAGEQGVVTLTATSTIPTSGFYLAVTNADFGDSIYLQGSLSIGPSGPPNGGVPEPGSLVLLASAALAVTWRLRTRTASR